MATYVQTEKPQSLSEVDHKLYYLFSNRHDALGESYAEITNDEVLKIAYRVYKTEE